MSFEDLQKLKEKLGTKVYNETIFGPRKKKIVPFKRENKNRPREMSTKSFINEIKENNLSTLKSELKKTEDPKEIKKIKYLIQRLENQLREQQRMNMKKEKQIQERKEIMNAIKSGQKPIFKKKSEKKVLDLISKYEELKSSGKLQTHITKLRKKALRKSRPQMEQTRWKVTDAE